MSNVTNEAIKAAAIPDAREARLLALVKDWQEWEKIERNRGCGNFAEIYRMCAVELEAALRGDA